MPRSCPKSLSNCRRAQTQALDKQLIGVEELVVESQERCAKALVELREVLEIGGVARATDPQQETLVMEWLHQHLLDQIITEPDLIFSPFCSLVSLLMPARCLLCTRILKET